MYICIQGIIQKKYGCVFGKVKNDCRGLGGTVSPPGVQGDATVNAWVKSPSNNFFHIKHTKTVTVRVNIEQKVAAIILL